MAIGKLGRRGGMGSLGVLGTASTWYYPDAAYDLDFQNGRYFGAALTSAISVSRTGATATDLLYTDAPGATYNTYAANTIRVKAGQGLLDEDSTTNLLVNPTAPATQTVTISATGNYWLWVNGSGLATVAAGTATISAGGTASSGIPFGFTVTATGTVTVTVSGTLSVFQLELGSANTGQGSAPTSFVNGTRNFEIVNFIGGTATLLLANTGSAIIYMSQIFNSKPGIWYLGDSAGRSQLGNFADNSGTFRSNNGTNAFNATLGLGTTQATPFKVGLKWNASNRSLVGNGGTVVQNTGSANFSGTPRMASGVRPVYPIRRLTLWATELADAVFQARTVIPGADQRIAAWGDSTANLFAYLGSEFSPNRPVTATGYAGKDSTYIATQMVAAPTSPGVVCWATGINNGPTYNTTTLLADDASMAAHVPSGHWLTGTIPTSPLSPIGSAANTAITAANNARKAAYPNNIADRAAYLTADSAYDLSNPADVVDKANGVVPYSKRNDIVPGTLTQSINASDTTFTISDPNLANGNVILIGSEYIFITGTSTNTVTSCVRGWAGTAAAHSNGDSYTGKDILHLNAAGNAIAAQSFHDPIAANGW